MSQVKVQALLALLVYQEPEENLAGLDLKVGKTTMFFICCVMFASDKMEVPNRNDQKVLTSFCQQVTEVCKETLGCQVSQEKRVTMERLELDFQAQLVLKVC